MKDNFKNLIIVILFMVVIAVFWFVYEYSKIHQIQRVFTVTGEGKEIVVPNIAEIKIGVITEGKDLKNLQEENSTKMNKIINFLKEQGIDDKDIKTENYLISPKYDYKTSPHQIIGYTISQNLIVKVRDLTKIGNILSKGVEYGANNISGPNFIVDEPEVYIEKAREKAIKDAKQKAEKIAKTAGFKLGKIISINEYSLPQPISLYQKEFNASFFQTVPQIEIGSNEIKVQLNITFEIK